MDGKLRVILFASVILSAATLYGDINILTNPDFETGTTGWESRGCTIATTTAQVHGGTYGAMASGRTETWHGIQQSIFGRLSVGTTCTMSGYVKTSSSSSSTVKLSVQKTVDGTTTYANVATGTASSSGWTYLSGSYTLNASGSLTALYVYFEGPDSGITLYVDDAEVMVPQSVESATGQINPMTHYQYIEGFGAAGAWYQSNLANHSQKTTLYNLLFRDLGLDIYRIRNTYQLSDSYCMNTDAAIISQGQAALGRPLKVMLSSWSPPASLKSNSSTREGTLAKDIDGNYRYTDFAQWWVNSLNAYAALGITPEYINMQNEPDYTNPGWDTCMFEATESTSNAGYNLAFKALVDAVSEMSNPPKLLAPEGAGFTNSKAYIDKLLDRTPVYAYAHHLYNGGDGSGGHSPDSYISGMTSFAAAYNDKPRMQTEFSCTADTGAFSDAMNLALLMHNALTAESVSAYLYWDLFWEISPDGLITIPNTSSYTIHPIYYTFKHYSAYIDAGWRRVAASTSNSNLRISAYAAPDNDAMTAVIINPSGTTSYNLTFTPNQFDLTSGSIYRTSPTENAVLVGSFTSGQVVTIPVSSVTTITMSGAIIPSDCPEAQDLGYRLAADLDGDCEVGMSDLLILVNQWLSDSPEAVSPNYSPDLAVDNKINLGDFAELAEAWLTCNDPETAGCIENW